jgi:hypothetical protein
MLESEFSLELEELMELHLEQHNSIPMFMAGLIMDLFRKSTASSQVHYSTGALSQFLGLLSFLCSFCGAYFAWIRITLQRPDRQLRPSDLDEP